MARKLLKKECADPNCRRSSVGTTLAALVCHCKHEVVVVGSGLEAIEAYSRHQPDVVLMDYWMAS